jgi:hypothetical protein
MRGPRLRKGLPGGNTRTLARFSDKWVAELKWLPDGRGLIAVYQDSFARAQVGYLEYPKMLLRSISRDTNFYSTLTVSSDGKTLATVQQRSIRSVTVLPGANGELNIQTTAAQNVMESAPMPYLSFNWESSRNFLLGDSAGLTRVNIDTKSRARILSDQGIFGIATCGTRYLLLTWALHLGSNSMNIWRTDADGSNPVQLTNGKQDSHPVCSPDLRWVYYYSFSDSQIARVPLSGGKPELLTKAEPDTYINGGFDVSSDGKFLVYPIVNQAGVDQRIMLRSVMPQNSTPQVLKADPRISGGVEFTPNGKAVSYPIRDKGVDDIWIQPLSGASPGRKITNFKSEQISEFYWSPDGKALGISRFHPDSDVVLIREKD